MATSIISEDGVAEKEDIARRIPWGQFVTHPLALTVLFSYWVFSFVGFMLLSEIPSFLTEVLEYFICLTFVIILVLISKKQVLSQFYLTLLSLYQLCSLVNYLVYCQANMIGKLNKL